MNQAIQEAQKLHEETTHQIQVILNDLNGAVKYILDGQNEHPNRIDIAEGRSSVQPSFGQQPIAPPSAPAFGKPSSFGGSSQATSTPAFGQPSLPGPNQPAFGKPSGLGTSMAGPTFGKPAMLGSAQPAFGRVGFGQPSFGQPGFGQPSAIGGSGFANASAGPSPFSQATQPNSFAQGNTSAFGQPSAPSPFGQAPSQVTASPFSQTNAQPALTTGFGQPPSTGSPFAQTSQTSSFAQTQPSSANPFSQAQTISSTPSVFGQPTATAPSITTTGQQPKTTDVHRASLGPKPIIKIDLGELNPIPDLTGETTRDPLTRRLTKWKGRPVQYKDETPQYLHPSDNKTWVHIFFPDGPPEVASLRDAGDKDENYTPDITEQYEHFVRSGFFKDDIIPKVPPKTEWVSFDF